MIVSKFLSFESKTRILLFLQKFKKNTFFDIELQSSKKKVFVFLAADYGNLGDVAITYAQTKFLQEVLPEYDVVDVPISNTLIGITEVKKVIQPHDIITTVGGGNFGDLYEQIEFYRQLVFENFPNNKCISFPQTIDFSVSEKGQKALQIAKKRYANHKNLTFVAREALSFEKMKTELTANTVLLTPDIVMSLNEQKPSFDRKGVVLCLREDDEKLLTKTNHDQLMKLVDANFDAKTYYDTHINKNHLSLEERKQELDKIWTVFKKAQLVITDRLHGMVFCYITNTPCIVFQNNNHKVKGCYEWIKNKSNIKLVQDFSETEIATWLDQKFYATNKFEPLTAEFDLLKKKFL